MSDLASTPGSKPKRLRGMVVQALLVALAFGLLGASIHANRGAIREVLSRPLNARLLAVAFGVYMTAIVLTFGRWYLLVRALGLPFRLRDAVRLGFIGNVFNLVIPGAVGGDLIKAAYLCREQSRRTQAVASMVIDRAVGLLGLFVLAGVCGLVAWGPADAQVRRLIAVVWVTTAVGLLGLGLIFTPALYGPILRLLRGRGRLEVLANELVQMAATYRSRLGLVGALLVGSSFTHGLYVLAFFLVSRALFPESGVSLLSHYLVVPLALFSTAIPLPFGALGVSENIAGELLRLVGLPSGAVVMMGYRVLMYGAGIVSAVVYLCNLRQVRALTHDVEAALETGSTAGGRGLGELT
jgi:uncharacterized membrane protein YbhN (UPF0104 family)